MNKDEIFKIIKDIEDKSINISDSWFYHASYFDEDIYKSILTSGIKSRIVRGDYGRNCCWNGMFYISVMKAVKYAIKDNAWNSFYPVYPMFVLKDIPVIPCKYLKIGDKMFLFYDSIEDTFLPFRGSGYIDEYQVFKKIKPEKIIALQFAIEKATTQIEAKTSYLRKLFKIVKLLDELGKDMLIFDYSTGKEINKEKCLTLSRNLDVFM